MAETTNDHSTIREWAEKNGGKPAAVETTHGDHETGVLRLTFPDAPNSEHDDLVEITWDEFFEKFEEANLALIYEPDSLFNKLVDRNRAH